MKVKLMNLTIKPKQSFNVLLLTTLLGSVSFLQACVPLAVVGVGAGVLMATDRRSTATQAVDNEIDFKGGNALRGAFSEKAHVNITAYNRIALLTGEVPTEADKKLAEDTLNRIINVRNVVNELQVAPNSSFGSRSNDVLLAGKIKASFVDAKDISANSFKVVVENSVAYLMGVVTEREAASAADIASRVKGVMKVVKVFEILTEDELRRMSDPANARPAPSSAPPSVTPVIPMAPPQEIPAQPAPIETKPIK